MIVLGDDWQTVTVIIVVASQVLHSIGRENKLRKLGVEP